MPIADQRPNVQLNATMIFQAYLARDGGIELEFLCDNPGPGQESLYTILLTDVELAAATNQAQRLALVRTKLQRKLRVIAVLDSMIGQSVVI